MIGEPLRSAASNYRHLALEECISTNTECMSSAVAGDPGNLWITSITQTGGKGSRGRSWESSSGNLHASLLLRNPCEKKHLAELTFVASLAVRDTLYEVAEGSDIGLKWPNDILVNGGKISGILLESTVQDDDAIVVIGIGINCKSHPQNTLYPATDLSSLGFKINPQALFVTLAKYMAYAISAWEKGDNFAGIRDKWLHHARGIGEPIRVNLPNREPIIGVFESIDEQGFLLLGTENGRKKISVGDVFFS